MIDQRTSPSPGATNEVLVRCDRLAIGYRGQAIAAPIDLSIVRGRFVVVIGRNGSGKSTWFRTLMGLIQPVSGRFAHPGARPSMTYVPQATTLDPIVPVRALDFVLWGRLERNGFLRPWATAKDRQAAIDALVAVDAAALSSRLLRELSGGQKQRVLLARMLVANAALALLDEPTAAMDAVAEAESMQRMREIAHRRNMAVVVVTHNVSLAARYADEVVLFARAEGDKAKIIFGSPAEVFDHPNYRAEYGDESHGR